MQKLSNPARAKVAGKKEKTAIRRSRQERVQVKDIEGVQQPQPVSAQRTPPKICSRIRKRFGPAPFIYITKTKIGSCPWELAPSA